MNRHRTTAIVRAHPAIRPALGRWLAMILVASLTLPAFAQQRTYWRDTDPQGRSPVNDPVGWHDITGANTGSVTIPAGGSIYFAAMNDEVDAKKSLRITLTWLEGDKRKFGKPTATGYRAGAPVPGYVSSGGNLHIIHVGWEQCPAWEYVTIPNKSGAPQTVRIHAQFDPTRCQKVARASSGFAGDAVDILEISEAACGVIGEMLSPLRITELEIYPEHQAVNQAVPPTFNAPPHTGNWTAEFSFLDPTGRPRPEGGARFFSDGQGIDVEDLHGLTLTMLDSADTRYTMYAWDAQLGAWYDYIIDLRELPWYEGFEVYEADEPLHGIADWRGWDNDPSADAAVSEANPHDGFKSLEITDGADLVRTFDDTAGGAWSFSAWQYIPSDFQSGGSGSFAGSYFILMNTYADGGPHEDDHWSVQMQFDSNDGKCKVFHGLGTDTVAVPYDPDRWVKIQTIVDLDEDWTQVYYDDELVTEYAWTGGVLGGGDGARDIAAVDLFAHGSSPIQYDDIELVQIRPPCRADFNHDGTVNTLDVLSFLNAWTAGEPEADFNGDGAVNTLDVLSFLNAWAAGC